MLNLELGQNFPIIAPCQKKSNLLKKALTNHTPINFSNSTIGDLQSVPQDSKDNDTVAMLVPHTI